MVHFLCGAVRGGLHGFQFSVGFYSVVGCCPHTRRNQIQHARTPVKPEALLSKDIRELLTSIGFACFSTEQGYRKDKGGTRTTPGIPDLIICGHGRTLFVELKVGKAKLTLYQVYFQSKWTEAGGTSLVWRSVDDAWNWCVAEGIIEETKV